MYYMQYLLQSLVKWRPCQSQGGVTAIEYALIAGHPCWPLSAG
jgi:hypothetical protein